MDAGQTPERVSEIAVTFRAPEAGWSRLTIRTAQQELFWPLSYLRDPFREDFTAWLEAVVEHGSGTLSIDSEGNIAEIRLVDAGEGAVRIFGESIYEGRKDILFEMPKRRFVSDFYSSLVAFWESDEIARHWTDWMWLLNNPDWRKNYGAGFEKPWPIRSKKIEAYLAAADA